MHFLNCGVVKKFYNDIRLVNLFTIMSFNWFDAKLKLRLRQLFYLFYHLKKKKIYFQGRNGKIISTPKHATVKEYRKANGFECLVGYFFVKKKTKRFEQLMNKTEVIEHMESVLNNS